MKNTRTLFIVYVLLNAAIALIGIMTTIAIQNAPLPVNPSILQGIWTNIAFAVIGFIIPCVINVMLFGVLLLRYSKGKPFGIALYVFSASLGALFTLIFFVGGFLGHIDCGNECDASVMPYWMIYISSALVGLFFVIIPCHLASLGTKKQNATPHELG